MAHGTLRERLRAAPRHVQTLVELVKSVLDAAALARESPPRLGAGRRSPPDASAARGGRRRNVARH